MGAKSQARWQWSAWWTRWAVERSSRFRNYTQRKKKDTTEARAAKKEGSTDAESVAISIKAEEGAGSADPCKRYAKPFLPLRSGLLSVLSINTEMMFRQGERGLRG